MPEQSQQHEPRITSITEPVRMVQIALFLPAEERDALFAAACSNRTAFEAPGGPGSEVKGSLFLSTDSDSTGTGVDAMREASQPLAARIRDALPQIFSGLGIEPFPLSEIPVNFIHGLDGHVGAPHVDSLDDRFDISVLVAVGFLGRE